MKKMVLIFCLLHAVTQIHAQSYKIPNSPVLQYLYNSNEHISTISNTDLTIYLPLPNDEHRAIQKLVKTKKGLFITVDGTGKVFKAIQINNNSIRFDRIDSTRHFGNSYWSIDFSYNDTLFSFGGYGFWHTNGQLRRFNSGMEWSIEKVHNIKHVINFIYNYLPKKHKIYYIEQPIHEEETFFQKNGHTAIVFDLEKKENIILGQINPILHLAYNIMIDAPSLNGTIIHSDNGLLLLDFEHNKVFKLKNKNIIEALSQKADLKLQNTFENGGTIYYTNYPDERLNSISISINDFEKEPYNLYESSFDENSNYINGIEILSLFILLLIIYIIWSKIYKTNSNKNKYIIVKEANEFSSIEATIIEKLIEKSKNESNFTVDDMNTYLGTKNKSIEIQKSIRTEAINRINHKFNENCNINTSLIQRVRSPNDARYMNYLISNDNAKIYLKYISKIN